MIGYGPDGSIVGTSQYLMRGHAGAAVAGHRLEPKGASSGSQQIHDADTPGRGPMRASMRRPDGGAGVSLFPAVRGYRRCLCGRLVTLFAVRGRPAVFCPPHQNRRDRWRLRRADRSQQ